MWSAFHSLGHKENPSPTSDQPIWPNRCGKPVLPIRIRWMEISLPSTRAPAVAPDTLIVVQPSQVRKFTTWFLGSVFYVCVCHCMSLYVIVSICCQYATSQSLSSLPLSPSWCWSPFWLFLIHYQHQRGSKVFLSFFIVLLKSPWNKNETIRNLHVKLQLRSHLTPRCAVEGVVDRHECHVKKCDKKDGWIDAKKTYKWQ